MKIKTEINRTQNTASKPKKNLLNFLNKDIRFGGELLDDRKKEAFYSELYILLKSGTDIKTALEIVIAEQKKDGIRKVFQEICDDVLRGKSLSEAMEKSGKFSPYEYFSLKIGEETGKILEVLHNLRVFFKKRIKLKRSISGALTYPILVISTAVIAVGFMLSFIVPMFEDVFKRFDGELPYLTNVIIGLADALKGNIGLIFLTLVAIAVFFYSSRNKAWMKKYAAKAVLALPAIGTLVRKSYLSRFCLTFSMLVSSKIPVLKAMQMIKKMINYYPLEMIINDIEKDILQGTALHKSLDRFAFFDRRMVSLIEIGEEANELEGVLDELGEMYTADVEYRVSQLNSLLEPLMIIFVGGMVATILIAMYLPLFQLSTSIF